MLKNALVSEQRDSPNDQKSPGFNQNFPELF